MLRAMIMVLGLSLAAQGADARDAFGRECKGEDLRLTMSAAELERLAAASDAVPFSRGRFYAVEKGGARSLLFGTFHLPGYGIELPAAIADEIATARTVLLEVTMDDGIALVRSLLAEPDRVLNPQGPFLLPEFTTGEWQALTGALAELGVPRLVINQLEPWVAYLALMMPPCSLQKSFVPAPGLDQQVEQLATDAGVRVRALETGAEVLDALAALPREDQLDAIRFTLPHLDIRESALITTALMYRQGRIMEIWALNTILAERAGNPEAVAPIIEGIWQGLVAERNARWLERLLPELDEGGLVIAVGALHLPGEDGLIRGLERAGHTVTALPDP